MSSMSSSSSSSASLSSSSFPAEEGESENDGDEEEEEEQVLLLDVLIAGGGVVGCALAAQLRRRAPGLAVGLVDASSGGPPPRRSGGDFASSSGGDAVPNPRSYALSLASLRLLGLLEKNSSGGNDDENNISNRMLGFYGSMQVWESDQPSSLVFDASDLGINDDDEEEQKKSKDGGSGWLGAVVEDSYLRRMLWSELVAEGGGDGGGCRLFPNSTVSDLQLPASAQSDLATVKVEHRQQQQHSLSKSTTSASSNGDVAKTSSTTIRSKIVVAADGARSGLCRMAGLSYSSHEYGQHALTFTVELDRAHRRRAFQRFLPTGPLALLPTYSDKHAIVVWSATPRTVEEWKTTGDAASLVAHLNDLLQEGPGRVRSLFPADFSARLPPPLQSLAYGVDKVAETLQYGPAMASQELTGRSFVAPPLVTGIASPRFSFPLSCRHVSNYVQPRFAVVGDAAHTVHPMAGQGLNIGLQDVAQLLDSVEKAVGAGMDPATFLDEYESARLRRGGLAVFGVHALQQLFGARETLAMHAKGIGMSFVQGAGPLRRALAQAASGLTV